MFLNKYFLLPTKQRIRTAYYYKITQIKHFRQHKATFSNVFKTTNAIFRHIILHNTYRQTKTQTITRHQP